MSGEAAQQQECRYCSDRAEFNATSQSWPTYPACTDHLGRAAADLLAYAGIPVVVTASADLRQEPDRG